MHQVLILILQNRQYSNEVFIMSMSPTSMLDSSECAETYFTNFCKMYKGDIDYIYYFHEGSEDPFYYDDLISTLLSKKRISIYCEGKDNVIDTQNFFTENEEYGETKCLFFIDKDYSCNEDIDENIYITPCYSIENLYVSSETLDDTLRIHFLMNEEDDRKKVLETYENLQNSFNNKTLFFNSWLSCQNDIKEKSACSTRLNIDKRVKKFFNKLNQHDDIITKDLELFRDFSELNNHDFIEKELYPLAIHVEVEDLNIKEK